VVSARIKNITMKKIVFFIVLLGLAQAGYTQSREDSTYTDNDSLWAQNLEEILLISNSSDNY